MIRHTAREPTFGIGLQLWSKLGTRTRGFSAGTWPRVIVDAPYLLVPVGNTNQD
jgi:hypothetical protein